MCWILGDEATLIVGASRTVAGQGSARARHGEGHSRHTTGPHEDADGDADLFGAAGQGFHQLRMASLHRSHVAMASSDLRRCVHEVRAAGVARILMPGEATGRE